MFSNSADMVTSPPFDSITGEQEAALKSFPHNITHLTLPRGPSGIEVASRNLAAWIKEGVLVRSERAPIPPIRLALSFTGPGNVLSWGTIVPSSGNTLTRVIIPLRCNFSPPIRNSCTTTRIVSLSERTRTPSFIQAARVLEATSMPEGHLGKVR